MIENTDRENSDAKKSNSEKDAQKQSEAKKFNCDNSFTDREGNGE